MKSKLITAMVQAKNEEKRLPLIFKNLENFSEIIVFDGGRTDGSEKLCNEEKITFISRPKSLRNIVGADPKFSIEYIKTPYVLYVNCSHYYPESLLAEFKRIAEEGFFHAVYHDVVIYTYGKIVHRPFFRRRSGATIFYKTDSVNFKNSVVHNEAPVELSKNLKFRLPAEDKYSVHIFRDYTIEKSEKNHSFYGDLDSKKRFESGIRTNYKCIIFKPIWYFLFQYIRCGSIKYGLPGLVYSLLYAQLELNIQLKLWELENDLNIDSISNLHLSIRKKLLLYKD